MPSPFEPTAHRAPALLCPFLARKCVQEKCVLWARFNREDGQVFEACTFAMQPVLASQQIVELARNQASADKVANEVAKGFGALTSLALTAAHREALSDGD